MITEYGIGSVGVPFVGNAHLIEVPQPAAGANFTQKFEAGALWRPLTVFFHLVTSAVVASREPGIQFADGDGKVFFRGVMDVGIPASTGVDVSFGHGIGLGTEPAASGSAVALGFPDLVLPPGFTVSSTVVALDPGDQISTVRLWVEEYDVGQGAYPAERAVWPGPAQTERRQ